MRPLPFRLRRRTAVRSLWHMIVLFGTLLCIALATSASANAKVPRDFVAASNFRNPTLPSLAASGAPVLIAPELDPHNPFEGIQQAKLNALDGGALFGTVMASSGDTLLVGAQESSAAYIFTRSQANRDQWQQIAKLIPNIAGYNFFAMAVALSGDIAVVGALESIGGSNGYEGVAYVYARNRGGQNMWGLVKKLLPHDPVMYGNFGATVAIDGDTIVIGATGDGTNGVDAGAAYVFERNQGGTNHWGEVAKLLASDGAWFDRFGTSVAISQNTIAVSATQSPGYIDDAGALYVFERATSQSNLWNQVARLIPSDSTNSDRFGELVTMSQDMLMVGNPYGGTAYLFERSASDPHAWSEVKRFPSASGVAAGYFGGTIATDGDRVLIGAIGSWVSGHEQGLVHVYQRNQGGADQWGEISRLSARDGFDAQRFGSSAVLNGDTIIVGANNDGPGAVYTYRLYLRPNAVDDRAGTNEDTPVAIDVLHNDSTPAGTGSLNPASVELLVAPVHGTTSIDTTSGAITYTPQPDFNGVDSFIYGVSNTIGTSRSATVTMSVRPVNDPPIFTSQPSTQVVAHSPYQYSVTASDVDTGDTLTISAPRKPAWLTFTASAGGTATLSGTPGDVDVGDHAVRLRVEDGGGLRATQSFTITVAANSPPRFTSTPGTIVHEGNRYFYSISAVDSDPGQALAISAPLMPSWLAFSDRGNGTAVLSGTASYADVGDHALQLRVEDVGGQSSTQAFTITVEPARPHAPNELVATPTSVSQIQLTWRDNSFDERGFTIERRTAGASWAQLANVDAGTSSYLDSYLQCGTSYEYRVLAFNEHWSSLPSNIASAAPSLLETRSVAYTGLPVPISNVAPTTAMLDVAQAGTITNILVHLDADHIYDGDLGIYLTSPDGANVALVWHNGGPGHNFTGTIFDDQATMAIAAGYAPFSGHYRPATPLAALRGRSAAGTWTLTVQNVSGGFIGSLKSFALDLTITAGCPGIPSTPTFTPTATPLTSATPTSLPISTPTATPILDATPTAPLAAVVKINSNADTGDGELAEGEIATVPIGYLSAAFNTDISGFKFDGMLLLDEGNQPGFQTSSCARFDSGDQIIGVNFRSFQYPQRLIVLGFSTPKGSLLPGNYRLLVCQTITGHYPLLDGDADGVGGGDFVRNFTVGSTMPTMTPTATPTATSTATPVATPVAPTVTSTTTPVATPGAGAQLVIDAQAGKPGSAFGITGSGYSADTPLVVTINGVRVGDLRTDQAGGFKLILDSVPEAGPGGYVVAVSPALTANRAAQSPSQPATVEYTLDRAAPLRAVALDGSAIRLSVPASISPLGGLRIYLPLVRR